MVITVFFFCCLTRQWILFCILFSERCTVIATVTGNKGEIGSIGGQPHGSPETALAAVSRSIHCHKPRPKR